MGSIDKADQVTFSDYEKIYLNMSRAFKSLNKEHWSVHCVCSIKSHSSDIETGLREAWKHLVLEYPGLTVRAVGYTKEQPTIDEEFLGNWASETFSVVKNGAADDVLADSEPCDLPHLYFLTQTSEVVFRSQHWRTDALGCCMILDRLFQLLVKQESTQKALHYDTPALSPNMERAAGASLTEDEDAQAYARNRIATFHKKAVQSGGFPYQGDATRTPARTTHEDLAFDADQTRAIVQACKNQQISVSAAIHAALAQTYFLFAEDEAAKQAGYTTVMAVNMRPHLQKPYNGAAHACQTYVSSITPTVPYESGFIDAARDLTSEYKTWCSDQLLRGLCWMYKYNADLTFAAPPKKEAPKAPPKPPSGVTLSSLGIVEKHLKNSYGDDLIIEKFRFGVSMMTRQTLLYAWTFQDKLTLSLDYNEAYYSTEMAQDIVKKVKASLEQGLSL